MNTKRKTYALPFDCFEQFNSALSEESDRARVIIVASWIDEFLKVKLMNEFSKGNSDARKTLFANNGPFATFSAKICAAFCAGWIDKDVHDDIQVIRKLRNDFAHNYNPLSLEEKDIRNQIESLKVPKRKFYDWGELRATSTAEGIMIYSGDKPSEAKEELHIPGSLTFRMALPVLLSVLASNLEIGFVTDEKGTIVSVKIPEYMKKGSVL